MSDRGFLFAVGVLGLLAGISILGAVVLAALGKDIPVFLGATAGTALGGIAGVLTRRTQD